MSLDNPAIMLIRIDERQRLALREEVKGARLLAVLNARNEIISSHELGPEDWFWVEGLLPGIVVIKVVIAVKKKPPAARGHRGLKVNAA